VYTCGEGLYGRLGLGDEKTSRRLMRRPQAAIRSGDTSTDAPCRAYHRRASRLVR
jgi:hypothetical protein